jgi:cytidylate kinase
MDYRVLTVEREYGSGGGAIAKRVAAALGWKLLDRELIEEIAYAAHVDSKVVGHYDECVESLLTRMNRNAVRASAALSIGVIIKEKDNFDEKLMTEFTRRIISHAHAECNCVIVGRGGQCVLRNEPDVFHVFIYAPIPDRASRLYSRHGPNVNVNQRIRSADEERANFIKKHFGESWKDPQLYDLMISSHAGEEATAETILRAMNIGRDLAAR